MQNMDFQFPEIIHGDGHCKVFELFVKFLFLGAPVKILSPDCDQSFHVRKWNAHVPACGIEFIGEGCLLELMIQLGDLLVRNSYRERSYGHVHVAFSFYSLSKTVFNFEFICVQYRHG